MRGSRFSTLLFVALLAVTFSATLSASPIFGQFTIAGSITVTGSTITWKNTDPALTADQASIGGTGLTGSFLAASLGGTTVSILDLNRTDEPVFNPSAPFSPPAPAQQFITFNAPSAAAFPMLNITEVFHGVFSSADCGAPATTPQLCTPDTPGNPSPFSFVNTSESTSTGSFVFSGVTSDGLATWKGVFTTQFLTSYQDVLAGLVRTGSVTNTYSATFEVTQAGVPEPGSMALMGLGLGLVVLSVGLRRQFSRRH
jgi:hypothetical protein